MVGLIILSIVGLSAMILPLWLNDCSHEWEIINKIPKEEIVWDRDDGHVLCTNKCMVYVQRCKRCGKLKHYIVK